MTEQARTETTLVVIQPTDVRSFFVERQNLDSVLAEIESLATDFKPDVATAKGRKLIASQAYAVSRTKTFIDGLGKELVDAEKEIPKRIDATRKRVRDFCDELQARVRQPLTDFENIEKARTSALNERMNRIVQFIAMAESAGTSSATLKVWLQDLDAIVIDESWQEFQGDAEKAKSAAQSSLYKALDAQLQLEAQQAEIARLKHEQDERDRIAREERIAEEARHAAEQKALREKIESEQREQAARDAQAKAERDAAEVKARLEQQQRNAEAQAALAAEQAADRERQRIADEQAHAQAEQERRAANIEHQRTYNRETIADFQTALPKLTKEDAIVLLKAIVNGQVRHVPMQY